TKMTLNFRLTYAEDGERKMILRHNVAKYGVQESEEEWWAYTNPDVVRHCATFWLIRKSNTWKRMTFQTYLDKLNIETFDAVTLDFNSGFVANTDVTAIVEKATYNSEERLIDFEVLTPVKAGTMSFYQHFWPAAVDTVFPAPGDFGGGGGIGVQASGVLPVGGVSVTDRCNDGIFIGGPNVVYQGPADRGPMNLNDSRFVVQPLVFPGTDFNIDPSENPRPSLKLSYQRPFLVEPLPSSNFFSTIIDIAGTVVIDSSDGGSGPALLNTVFKEITNEGDIAIDTEAKFSDGENESTFDFRFDDEGEVFGAGTAFLKDDS
ncbi:MAG: hypothetical protein KDA84_11650, partial [Planctomycetaceae bacterium]|nr:hypothetical protein [Planctomycetaceae bacterium]